MLEYGITIVKPQRTSRDPIVIATRVERTEWTGPADPASVRASWTRARARAPAFITDTNLILRFIIESMTIIVPTGIP